MGFLSDRATTAVVTGGYVHIIIPRGAAPTGYDSFRISVTDLQAALQTQITANAADIATNASNISDLQDIVSRSLYQEQTSNFQFSQPANSVVFRIRARAKSSATLSIGTTPSGTEISGSDINLSANTLYTLNKDLETTNIRTIYFTITGNVSAELYYNRNSIIF